MHAIESFQDRLRIFKAYMLTPSCMATKAISSSICLSHASLLLLVPVVTILRMPELMLLR